MKYKDIAVISEDDLEKWGCSKYGDRKKLHSKIKELIPKSKNENDGDSQNDDDKVFVYQRNIAQNV